MPHALVIGGTGMLRGVSFRLARRGLSVSVVARSHARLSALVRDPLACGLVHAVPADYTDQQRFAASLRAAAMARGPFDLAVCWVHHVAAHAVPLVAGLITRDHGPPAHLVQIVGCEAHHLSRDVAASEDAVRASGVRTTRVILGWMRDATASRWLTDEEICTGTMRGVDGNERDVVVGVTSPWTDRPPY